jgi:hypothetical protein
MLGDQRRNRRLEDVVPRSVPLDILQVHIPASELKCRFLSCGIAFGFLAEHG